MREFNTTGPCNPALHYTVMREALIAEGLEKVRKGRYFTLFAPRQAGKTTYFQLLLEAVRAENFTPIWISFESLKTVTREVFYQSLNHQLHQELAEHQIEVKYTITNPVNMVAFFEQFDTQTLVLIIDEFEGVVDNIEGQVRRSSRYLGTIIQQAYYHRISANV
jgi:predicted ATPase